MSTVDYIYIYIIYKNLVGRCYVYVAIIKRLFKKRSKFVSKPWFILNRDNKLTLEEEHMYNLFKSWVCPASCRPQGKTSPFVETRAATPVALATEYTELLLIRRKVNTVVVKRRAPEHRSWRWVGPLARGRRWHLPSHIKFTCCISSKIFLHPCVGLGALIVVH
jgi:hypothetical protein